jgi:hypothetical protein
MLERILEGEGIDDRGEHAHLVRGRTVHPAGFVLAAADEIAGADYDREFNAERGDFLDFESDVGERVEIDAAVLAGGRKCLA